MATSQKKKSTLVNLRALCFLELKKLKVLKYPYFYDFRPISQDMAIFLLLIKIPVLIDIKQFRLYCPKNENVVKLSWTYLIYVIYETIVMTKGNKTVI